MISQKATKNFPRKLFQFGFFLIILACLSWICFLASRTSRSIFSSVESKTSEPCDHSGKTDSFPRLEIDCDNLQIDTKLTTMVKASAGSGKSFEVAVYQVNDIVSQTIKFRGSWELDLVNRVVDELNKHPGSVFVDIGANIGSISFAVAARGFSVYAVEPLSSNIELLSKTWCSNPVLQDKVLIYPHGISLKPNKCVIYSHDINVGDGHIACFPDHFHIPSDYSFRSWLKTGQLDSILSDLITNGVGIVMKVDVEGYEQWVLESAPKLVARVHTIFAECNAELMQSKGSDPSFYNQFANQNGFDYAGGAKRCKGESIVMKRT